MRVDTAVSTKFHPKNLTKHKLPRCPNNCSPESDGGSFNNECECFNGFIVDETVAAKPAAFLPGTPEKLAILSARIIYGFPLHLPNDVQDRSHLGMAMLIPTPMDRRA